MAAAPRDPTAPTRRAWWVRGMVQGVGFRPFVVRQARRLGLSGHVSNRSGGVRVEAVEGVLDEVSQQSQGRRAG